MNNTTTASPASILVIECPDHSSVSAPDLYTARTVTDVARWCAESNGDPEHARTHFAEGTDCWACCERQIIHQH